MNANVVLDLNELAEYVASKALKIIEEKQKPVITNAQKFKEVFGLTIECDTNLDRDRRAFTIQSKDKSWRKKQSEWLDLPYKESRNEQ